MSDLGTLSDVAAISGGLVLPVGALTGYFVKHWIDKQIVSKLSNDSTPVAKYAHDARDRAEEAKDFAEKSFNTALKTHDLIVDHITNSEIHRVP